MLRTFEKVIIPATPGVVRVAGGAWGLICLNSARSFLGTADSTSLQQGVYPVRVRPIYEWGFGPSFLVYGPQPFRATLKGKLPTEFELETANTVSYPHSYDVTVGEADDAPPALGVHQDRRGRIAATAPAPVVYATERLCLVGSATQLRVASPTGLYGVRETTIVNLGDDLIFVGGSLVTIDDGLPIASGGSLTIATADQILYGIASVKDQVLGKGTRVLCTYD